MHRRIGQQARLHPRAVALDDGSCRLTYAELDAAARGLAVDLAAQGVGPGQFIPLFADRSVDAVVGMLGILYAGAAYVPISPDQPAARVRRVLDEIRATLIVAGVGDSRALAVHRLPVVTPEAAGAPARIGVFAEVPFDWDDPAYAIATSGSTGVPKIVVIRHRNLANYIEGIGAVLRPSARARTFATTGTFAADLGHTAIFPALATGGTLCVLGYHEVLEGAALQRRFDACRVDVLKTTPSHLRALLASAPDPAAVLPHETLVCGGEPLAWETVRRVRELRPDCRVVNHYGPTETTVGALAHCVVRGEEASARGTVPIGLPLDGTRAYVLDELQRPVAPGDAGELYIGGKGVAAGYLGRPQETAASFVVDPFVPNAAPDDARMYRTGDRVRLLADGEIAFLGRLDDQVKIRGRRVEPSEVAALLGDHPAVGAAAVVARQLADGETVLDAYLTGTPVVDDELHAFAAQLLPAYMIPRTWTFLEKFPVTANGKLDAAALPPPAQRAPAAPAALGDATQAQVAAIWREILDREAIAPSDDFFELGGHSLLATIAVARICESLGVSLTLRAFLECSSLSAIAMQIDELRVAHALAELDGLSDSEVRLLLSESDS